MSKSAVWSDTPRRLLTIAIGAPLILSLIYFGHPIFTIGVLLVGVLAAYEIAHMIRPDDRVAALVLILLVSTYIVAEIVQIPSALLAVVLLMLALTAVVLIAARRLLSEVARRYAYLLLAALWIGLPLGFLIPIRQLPDGLGWTLMLFLNNWSTDSLALIGGRVVGRHKLAPSISSGKTVEGALVGLAGGFLMGMGIALLFNLPIPLALLLNVLIPLLTEAGDLLESKIKRIFHTKDTGGLLPGHGGIVDRIDGLLLAAPVAYFILLLFL